MNTSTSDLWDAAQWASDFSAASKARYAGDYAAADTLHDLRARVFADTVERVRAGGYTLADGTRVDLPFSPTVGDDTRFYDRELPAGPAAAPGISRRMGESSSMVIRLSSCRRCRE